jgi:predicted transposase YdaD
MKEYLETHRAEVTDMLFSEYDENIAREVSREDGREEGIVIGEARGDKMRAENTARIMLENNEPIEKIMKYSGLARKDIEELKAQLAA